MHLRPVVRHCRCVKYFVRRFSASSSSNKFFLQLVVNFISTISQRLPFLEQYHFSAKPSRLSLDAPAMIALHCFLGAMFDLSRAYLYY